jgi:hypothetical protein
VAEALAMSDEFGSIHEALEEALRDKPIVCVRCGAAGEITLETVSLIATLYKDGALGPGSEIDQENLRTILVLGVVDMGWGAAGKDEDAALLVSCPACAMAEELASAREFAGTAAILGYGFSRNN